MLFRPCDRSCDGLPAGLRTWAPPYPAVVIVHGGAASQEMYLWAAEALAESGYMVLTFQVPNPENAGGGGHYPDAKAALEFLLSTSNPRWAELDRERIGLAGHSAGGVAVSRLGQEDPRVGAIVSWDRAQSTPLPADLPLRTPALFVTADFNCQRVPVCLPEAYPSPPDPRGPGNKDEDFQRVAAAGLDTMKISLRAATHLDFTEFAPTPPSSRYGAIVTSYYTLAWFDRYLRGASAARLTAERFDDSADVHYISGGTFDPATGATCRRGSRADPCATGCRSTSARRGRSHAAASLRRHAGRLPARVRRAGGSALQAASVHTARRPRAPWAGAAAAAHRLRRARPLGRRRVARDAAAGSRCHRPAGHSEGRAQTAQRGGDVQVDGTRHRVKVRLRRR